MVDDYQVPSLVGACRLLRALAASTAPLSVSAAARAAGIPRTTALRQLRTLVAEGLAQVASGGYRMGTGLLKLSAPTLASTELRKRAVPVLRRLAETSGDTAHLAVQVGDRTLLLEVCDGPQSRRVTSRPGSLAQSHTCSTGKVLLAGLDLAQRREVVAHLDLARLTANTITDPGRFLVELERVARQGYGVDDEEAVPGVRCVAVPVRDAHGQVVAAIGITGEAARYAPRLMPKRVAQVRAAARELEGVGDGR